MFEDDMVEEEDVRAAQGFMVEDEMREEYDSLRAQLDYEREKREGLERENARLREILAQRDLEGYRRSRS